MAPFSAVKSDTSPQCPNTSCRGAAIRFIGIDHCRRGKPGGAFLALEPIPPLELLALLREENWGSGLIQINDSSSAIKATSSRSRPLLVQCSKASTLYTAKGGVALAAGRIVGRRHSAAKGQ